MNKLKVNDDILDIISLDGKLAITTCPKNEIFDVNSTLITVNEDTSLEINYATRKATKLDVKIRVMPNVNFELKEYRLGKNFKIRYQYSLMENSTTTIYKFYDVAGIKEMNIINLMGENAKIDYNFKTISKGFEKYNMTIYHNAPGTISDIKNNGVNINKGSLQFNVSSFVGQNHKACNVNQASRIINLTDSKCGINPNLFIDEYDVIANHSALIGRFSDDEMFYLNSRGLNDKEAINLLINGFLISNMPEDMAKKIIKNTDKYWR